MRSVSTRTAAVSGARIAGASRIIVVDIQTKRLDVARRFGATDSIDSTKSEPFEAVRNDLPRFFGPRLVWRLRQRHLRRGRCTAASINWPTAHAFLRFDIFDCRTSVCGSCLDRGATGGNLTGGNSSNREFRFKELELVRPCGCNGRKPSVQKRRRGRHNHLSLTIGRALYARRRDLTQPCR
jgi:hypothetical protein